MERIDCSAAGAVFHLKTAAGTTTVTAPKLDDVDFITYRSDVTGQIECGPSKQPMPVYVTWRPATDGSGARIVVAVEFLPRALEMGANRGLTKPKSRQGMLIPWQVSLSS
ncbi:MAG TPA: hypothetical protein VES67_10455 [Vicinamibacterales bacterium]|nr:hypothetical protein [Vicinamibacterales bacterium]